MHNETGGMEDDCELVVRRVMFLRVQWLLFAANNDTLPELTAAQVKKLKHLTIVSLANKNKVQNKYC